MLPMIDPGRRYTAAQKTILQQQGYEFQEVTTISDSEPMFAVSGYKPVEPPRGLSEDNHAGWERP